VEHSPIGPKVALHVGRSAVHGLGVFADQAIKPNQVIEVCPTIVIPPEHVADLDRTAMVEYVYPWEDGNIAVLGFGMIYNHAVDSNAEYLAMREPDLGVVVQLYIAIRAIEEGDEITVNYAGARGLTERFWFDD
jgi:hypothetical protein